ncbi:MAG: CDP-glycerol glycerophosphotransferase family protein [Acutalibacteraceae bacterium]|nr:CDP-glycerol glycerophosphotransferase family protein [Acutalibacteraceae bacterium]
MSNTVVSVILPYLEENIKIKETLSSICTQKGFDSTKIEILIIDVTKDSSSKKSIGNLSICKVISTKAVSNEAEACKLAVENATGKYITLCRCGDIFSDTYFSQCLSAFEEFENVPFVAVQRYCINPVYKDKKANRLNKEKAMLGKVINIDTLPSKVNNEVWGTLFKTEVFKKYPINTKLRYEYFQDFIIRLQLDYPEYIVANNAEYRCFMPLEDDSAYFVPSNHIEWYKESMEEFLLPLAKDCVERFGEVPKFIQYYLMFAVSSRFLANMNNRNKRNMNETQLAEFFDLARKVMKYIDDIYVLNTNKYKSLSYSEEAAEMFYMLKYNCAFADMPLSCVEGKNEIYLNCSDVFLTRLTDQRVGLHVLDYRDGKLIIDGSFRRVFNLEDIELYVMFNEQKYTLSNTDRYSLTKYFGISAYKKFTFHLELPLDSESSEQTVEFFAKYKHSLISLKLSFLHHWAKFTASPANSYWRFNKYVAYVKNAKVITIKQASPMDTFKRELKFLPGVFKESKRLFITRLQYWITRPYFKNKKIWLMLDKLYKGGDSSEYLYRFCADKNDGITRYYIIDENTSDYKSLKEAGLKPVKNRSLKHRMAFLNADIALITNSMVFPFNGYSMDRSRFIRGLCNFPTMCLQHGLSVQKCAMAQQRIVDNTQMYFLASKHEHQNLSNHAYGYQNFDILKMTGIGRYDGLINNDQKQILLSPTWRMYNAMPVTTSEGEQRAYNPEFKETTYYKIYNDLINNPKLIETAKKTGYKIKYLLHPILSAQVNDFVPDPYVEVISSVGDLSYEKILTESSLMVTDYSGVQFDFAYMKKPLVYFHPSQLPAHYDDGGFFYDTMGFGEICTESHQLVDMLCEYMENGCKMKPMYIERVENFYEYDDHNNCQRIYDEIMKFQKQVDIDKMRKK